MKKYQNQKMMKPNHRVFMIQIEGPGRPATRYYKPSNPRLLNTTIRFNGQESDSRRLMEPFYRSVLKTWEMSMRNIEAFWGKKSS